MDFSPFFDLLCTLLPLFCVTVVALWSGILFKSYDSSEPSRVREIAARSLGLFLALPLTMMVLVQLFLFLRQTASFAALQIATSYSFIPSLALIGLGVLIWCYIWYCGCSVDGDYQTVDALMRRSYRLAAIGSVIPTVAILAFSFLFPLR